MICSRYFRIRKLLVFNLVILFSLFCILSEYRSLVNYTYPDYSKSAIKSTCKLPTLDFVGHNTTLSEQKCAYEKDWGYLKNNKWHINSKIKAIYPNVYCEYKPINRDDDFFIKEPMFMSQLEENQSIKNDVIEVNCKKNSSSPFEYTALHIQLNKIIKKNFNLNTKRCKPLDIMLISFDSVSRISWLKRMPRVNKFIFETMRFNLLNGYNIVGDGTPAALVPLLTGKTEEELPDVFKNNRNARYVDEAFPFIWKDLHKLGYTTMYLEDNPFISPFTYRMKGFYNNTCDYYFRHYQLKLWNKIKNKQLLNDFCNGGRKCYKILFDLISDFKHKYSGKPNFVFLHSSELTHDTNDRLNWIENDLYNFLSKGYKENLFTNTAIFLYSDHGARFFDKKAPNNRYLEERLPFFAVYLPNEYKQNHYMKFKNLKNNLNLLTSPFDIYSTLRDVSCLELNSSNSEKHPLRSISLLNKIPLERDCDHIGISDHYCTCLKDWKSVDLNNRKIIQAAEFTINSINEITLYLRQKCSNLRLLKLISAEILSKNTNEFIRIQFISDPNKGVYESVVANKLINTYEFKSVNFSIKSSKDISRIDAYDRQPDCLMDSTGNQSVLLDIRKFCYCK